MADRELDDLRAEVKEKTRIIEQLRAELDQENETINLLTRKLKHMLDKRDSEDPLNRVNERIESIVNNVSVEMYQQRMKLEALVKQVEKVENYRERPITPLVDEWGRNTGLWDRIDNLESGMRGLATETAKQVNTIEKLLNRVKTLRSEVAELMALQNKQYICAGGEVVEALTEGPRLKTDTVNGKLVPWSDELEQFFEPWSKLGLDGKVPMEPGEGYEFLPHLAVPEEGDEFWHIEDSRWKLSGEARPGFRHHSEPSPRTGPYRRKIKQPAPPTPRLV